MAGHKGFAVFGTSKHRFICCQEGQLPFNPPVSIAVSLPGDAMVSGACINSRASGTPVLAVSIPEGSR